MAAAQFQFIACQTPSAVKDRSNHRLARSHGARHSFMEKRRKLEQLQENFRLVTEQQIQQQSSKSRRTPAALPTPARSTPSPTTTIQPSVLDPFDSLAVDCSKLQVLLEHPSARQATEPVFSISDRLSFQSFRSVFRTGLDDPAATNALMLSLLFAANEGKVDTEFLACKNQAIQHINNKIACPLENSIEATIGSILLLIGVESRLGVRSHVQIHLQGILQLLGFCNSRQIYLCDGIKRAIFWQDLNAALTTGTERILSHGIFPELEWRRDPFCFSLYTLPAGFGIHSELFPEELIEILEDIHALQQIRSLTDMHGDAVSVQQLDNQQAWIESRLYYCYRATDRTDFVLLGCVMAAYLCTYMLFAEIWGGQWIPSFCSSQLLRALQLTENSSYWDGHEDLLVWLLVTGGAFAQPAFNRSEYTVLLHGSHHAGIAPFLSSWPDVQDILQNFIWSERLFSARGKAFWEACCIF
ncbi:hypothetical protein NA57DRAFT_66183 [Rhizodiscina lignyota]|uniref:Transcription factor domain-containing protein n=1 Tax=Rhizodiscina lignyota TaxID=1504668 RepID=A0A9P4IG14_9PEZI|nr:hypothetical protein NA57DRAFT_66183 [Rhizodiscina lignyota]